MENPVHKEFAEYVTRRGPALLRTARRLTADAAEAEDLLQTALTKTYLAWDRIHDRAALDGYVRRAMVNTQISWWRRRRLEVYPAAEPPDRPVEDCTRRSELRDSLYRALRRLPTASGRRSCSATTRTSPRPRSPNGSASASGR